MLKKAQRHSEVQQRRKLKDTLRSSIDFNAYQTIKNRAEAITNKYGIKNYIEGIYLVGSRAKGTARQSSDYDFVIKVKNLQEVATKGGKFNREIAERLAKMEDEIDMAFKDFRFAGTKTHVYVTPDIEGKAIKLVDNHRRRGGENKRKRLA